MKRLSRPCYDKPHRCPGWAGGGWKSAKVDRCENGSIRTRKADSEWSGGYVYPSAAKWRFGHCVGGVINKMGDRSEPCNTVTIPWALRRLDPRWWLIYVYRIQNWLYFRKRR